MTHGETSLRTKKALCTALKELMRHKPFSKITVSELIRECNINRKTFYYHFEDIYALLKWMLEQETFEVVKQFNLLVDYKDAFLFVINYVEQNSYFLNCIYDSIGRDQMKRFFCQDFVGLIENLIISTEKSLDMHISDELRFFLCNLYTEGIAGMLINLFQHPEDFTPQAYLDYLALIIHTSIPAVIRQANEI